MILVSAAKADNIIICKKGGDWGLSISQEESGSLAVLSTQSVITTTTGTSIIAVPKPSSEITAELKRGCNSGHSSAPHSS